MVVFIKTEGFEMKVAADFFAVVTLLAVFAVFVIMVVPS